MAEPSAPSAPWTDDLAALGTHTRAGLPSLAHTRAACTDPERTVKPMRFWKLHPALTALIVLVLLGIAAPVAYAIANRVFVSIDTNKSEAEIEADVKAQLEAAGVGNATVTATKTDDTYEVAIASDDLALGKLDLEVDAPNGKKYHVHLDIPPTLPEEQQLAVGEAASKALNREGDISDADLEASIRADLTAHGVSNAEVRVRDASVSIIVR